MIVVHFRIMATIASTDDVTSFSVLELVAFATYFLGYLGGLYLLLIRMRYSLTEALAFALLDGGPTVDLAGKGLARVEVEIAAARDLRSISPVPPLHLPCISAGGDRRAAAAW